ncbi:MAG: molybdate ABC transporter substrate-binding protein [Chloroflexi bacterium]|nr:MAG: molybdate ABC transporter substrate-binding protein [Chloroflexota bacterium]
MKVRLDSLLLAAVLYVFLAACGSTTTSPSTTTPTAAPVTLNLFAAASLTESFNEIATNYQVAHPGVKIKYNFNGSQILVQQIINGAPADIFASADQANMKKASDAGMVGSSQIFAKNRLVVIVPVDNPGKIMTLKDLARESVKIDSAAPAVPAGKYSLQVLDNMGQSPTYGPAYVSAVKANFVSQEENVKAVVQKVQLGEVDAGLVYLTDVTTQVASKLKMLDIPDNFNVIAQYPIAIVKNSTHATEAQAFVRYLLATQGQAVLQKYHFVSVNG